jgi:hypothetical protein
MVNLANQINSTVNMKTFRTAFPRARVGELWAVTSYFNPSGYQTKLQNFLRFKDGLAGSGVQLLTIECVFGDTPFSLPPAENLLQIRSKDTMWQKERLLNVALTHLPPECTKVAWLDCDILFENESWALQTAKALNDYPIVQPFDNIVRLPKGHSNYLGEGHVWSGFGAVYRNQPQLLTEGDFDAHGHTGFAWAARRDLLTECGIYDASLAGGADHLMAHAFCGDWDSSCIEVMVDKNSKAFDHFAEWANHIYGHVRGRITAIPGRIDHLWHGDTVDRRYYERHSEFKSFDFDPKTDIRIGDSGCWEWNSAKAKLHQWAILYFEQRKEDG